MWEERKPPSFSVTVQATDTVPAGKRAWLYSRSTVPINTKWVLEMQQSTLSRCATRMGYGVIGFSEDCAGGQDAEGPGLLKMARAAADYKFDVLFVMDASHLCNEPIQAAELLRTLKFKGFKVYSVLESSWLTGEALLNMAVDANWAPLTNDIVQQAL